MFPIKTQMLTKNKYSRPGTKLTAVKGIIIHWTANEKKGADAYANIRYFENRKLGKTGYGSAHYFVDSKNIVQCLPNNELAYHVGAASYKTKKYGSYPNNCTIGIEMCVNNDGNFAVVYEQTVLLTAKLMKQYGLNPDNALDRHFDITGKNCPAMFTSSHWGKTNHSYAVKYGVGSNADSAWSAFKQQVKKAMNGATVSVPAKGQVATSTKDYLIYGDKGEKVKLHQDKLTRAGYPLEVDGIFGPAMKAAVIKFQKGHGLIADGIHGAATQKKLDEVLIAMRNKPTKEEVIAMLKDIAGHSLEKNIKSMYDKGITLGDKEGNFNPNAPATRAHVAAFLDRTIDYIMKEINKK